MATRRTNAAIPATAGEKSQDEFKQPLGQPSITAPAVPMWVPPSTTPSRYHLIYRNKVTNPAHQACYRQAPRLHLRYDRGAYWLLLRDARFGVLWYGPPPLPFSHVIKLSPRGFYYCPLYSIQYAEELWLTI